MCPRGEPKLIEDDNNNTSKGREGWEVNFKGKGKGAPNSTLKSFESDTLDLTRPFILRQVSTTKPMVINVPSDTRNLCNAQRDMNGDSCSLWPYRTNDINVADSIAT